MNLKKFISSRVFLRQLLFALGIAVVAVMITMQCINWYTHHGEAFAVPDFRGMTLEEVVKERREDMLRFKVIDSAYVKDVRAGAIIEQTPEAGWEVKRNRTIFLTIAAATPEMINMPRLTDISLRQAITIMEMSGLRPGEVRYKPSQYADVVLEQWLGEEVVESGNKVAKGTAIDLVVGLGPSGEKVLVPDLSGMTVDEARGALQSLALAMGVLIYDESFETAEDSLNAVIWRQKPEASSVRKVRKGSPVDCWLTVKRKD